MNICFSCFQMRPLESAKGLTRNFVSLRGSREQTASIFLANNGPITSYETQFLFDYDIFPAFILRYKTEWEQNSRQMREGDVIIQRVMVPPFVFGVCLDFAVRVTAIYQMQERLGFAYETLRGHVESGISEFYFEERPTGLFFTIRTLSKPCQSTRLCSLLVLLYQKWCTNRALQHVKSRFGAENSNRSG
jgi:hypothetical protein